MFVPSTSFENGRAVVEVVAASSSSVAGTVRSQVGAPVSGAMVKAYPQFGGAKTVLSGDDGTFAFRGLPECVCEFQCEWISKLAQVRDGQTIDFVLGGPSASVVLDFRGLMETTLRGSNVSLLGADGTYKSITMRTDTVELELSPGEYLGVATLRNSTGQPVRHAVFDFSVGNAPDLRIRVAAVMGSGSVAFEGDFLVEDESVILDVSSIDRVRDWGRSVAGALRMVGTVAGDGTCAFLGLLPGSYEARWGDVLRRVEIGEGSKATVDLGAD